MKFSVRKHTCVYFLSDHLWPPLYIQHFILSLTIPRRITDNLIYWSRSFHNLSPGSSFICKRKDVDAMQVHLSWLVCEVCLLGILWSVLVIYPALTLDYCWRFTTDGCVQRHCWDLMCPVTNGKSWNISSSCFANKKCQRKLDEVKWHVAHIYSGNHSKWNHSKLIYSFKKSTSSFNFILFLTRPSPLFFSPSFVLGKA